MGSAAALVESQVRLAGGRAPAAEAAAAAPEAEATAKRRARETA